MKKSTILTLLVALIPTALLAQLTITSPQSRLVVQRNQANQATITVSGQAPPSATWTEARLVPLQNGSATDWTPVNIITNTKTFQGNLTAAGGWYRLDVRAWADGNLVGESSIDRVGVGEVFVVAGQSNAYGNGDTPGASDDRVSVVDFRDSDLSEQLLPLRFSHADAGGNAGPSNPLHIWGMLGDELVRRLGVPVLFLGAAQPGTTSDQWRKTAENNPDEAANLAPYRRLGAVLLHYVARTGARAVLWHQGEGDTGRGYYQQYIDNVTYVINKSRQQTGYPLPWVISRVSYILGQTDGSIIAAQNALINQVPNAFAGPYTDVLTGDDNRADNVHFSGAGLVRLADLWNQSLTDDFFARSAPFSMSHAPTITTGYVLPVKHASGDRVWVPYVARGPFEGSNAFKAQVLTADGVVVAESGVVNQNPLPVTLPANLPSGQYRTRVVSTAPAQGGNLGEWFSVTQGGSPAPELPTVSPTVTGGTADGAIQRVGYKYDVPSHGFQLLVGATVSTEVRLERIDGGGFGETNWGGSAQTGEYAGYSNARYYGPVAAGMGGVEPGRYRLSVRRAGNSGTGIWIEVNLLNGRNTVYATSDGASPTTPEPVIPPAILPTSPGFTPVTVDAVQDIGYKYDMPTHGFQLLSKATGQVEMKLERLDGVFAETNWQSAQTTTAYQNYSYQRTYSPVGAGVGGVEPGRYRLSVRPMANGSAGQSVDVTLQNGTFPAGGGTAPLNPPAPPDGGSPAPPVPGASAGGLIRKIGYKYDMPTHGFQLLADASVPVEMRLERLDGGFGETNWATATASTEYNGYTYFRYYSPVGLGVGGVEPGHYRLWVRKVGDAGNGQAIDVTLQNGLNQVATPNARVAVATESSPEDMTWRSWPNPAERDVTVAVPSVLVAGNLQATLTTLTGQTSDATTETLPDGNLRVILGDIPTGLYLLRLTDGDRPVQVLKVLKR